MKESEGVLNIGGDVVMGFKRDVVAGGAGEMRKQQGALLRKPLLCLLAEVKREPQMGGVVFSGVGG